MQPGSVEHFNIRLSNQEKLSSPADLAAYDQLWAEVGKYQRAGEVIERIGVGEIDAWKRSWAILAAMRVRGFDREATAAAEALSKAAAADHRLFGEYTADVAALCDLKGQNRFLWASISEWAGLQEGDLTLDAVDPKYGRPANWEQKARRVGAALVAIQGLTPEAKRNIPAIVEERRLRAHLRATEARLAALEQKVAAIESRLPQAEIRETADAA